MLFKYKAESVEELVTLREQIREKLKKVEGGSEEIERQEKKLQETEKRMLQLAGKIHEMRVSMEGKLCATMKKTTGRTGNQTCRVSGRDHGGR